MSIAVGLILSILVGAALALCALLIVFHGMDYWP